MNIDGAIHHLRYASVAQNSGIFLLASVVPSFQLILALLKILSTAQLMA